MKNKATFLSSGSLLAALLLILVMVVPVFAAAPIMNNQTLSIAEGSADGTPTTPNKIVVFDPEGDHLNGKLEFDVLSGDGQAVFDVGFSTGIVTLKVGQTLDYETKTSYTLNVRVQDSEDLTDTATITINVTDVSDEPPVMNNQSFNVPENSPNNTLVGKIAFTDIDVNDTHTFTILSGNGGGGGAFQIAANGNITVKDSAQLNFEAQTTFVLNVRIEDAGGAQDTADITINVTNVNEKPVVNDQTFNGLSENAPNGTIVGTVIGTDPDNDPLQYFRTSGSAAFAINATTGQVTVADSNLLNFEVNPSPTFVVTANDGKGQSDTATITVNLDDVNDPPRVTGSGIPDVIVNEGTASATRNLWAAFEDDEDADNQLTFAIQNNSNTSLFSPQPIPNNGTGMLTLNFADGATGIANITVRAFDTDGAFVDDTFKVDFNEAPEAVGFKDVSVQEDAGNTTIDLATGFTDAEQSSSDLTYAIVLNTNPGLFTSVDINGTNLVLDYAPDANGQANITIKATDIGGLSAQTILKVKVNAVNDKPTTSGIANVDVDEDAPNRVIDLTKAFDDKEDGAAGLTYEVKSNTNPGLFDDVKINPGQNTLTLAFKANAFGTAELTIRATDSGVPGNPGTSEFVETTFTVNVAAVNDPPVLSDITMNIDEDQPIKFTASDFTSHFSDADGDNMVNVRIQSLPTQGTLKLGPDNVTINQVIAAALLKDLAFIPAFNWDSGSTSFNWNASDGSAYATEAAKVTITVEAVNDAPVISDVQISGSEGVNVLFKQSDFTGAFTDVDGDSLVKIKIVTLPAHGTLKLGPGNVTENQQINAANLSDLRYVPDEFYSGEDQFNWAGSDGNLYSSPAQVIITLAPQNDPPTLDLNGNAAGTGFNATFVAGKSPVKIASQSVTIADVDDTMMEGATIIIVNRVHGTKEVLDATIAGTNITKSFSAASGVLTLSGTDTIANYEKVLKTVTFRIDADVTNPDTAVIRDVSFRVYDGEENSNDAISEVTVINPRIQVTVTPKIQTVAKGNTAVFTVTIENTGSVDLTNIEVSSANVPDCDRTFDKIEAGKSLKAFACIVTDVQARVDNEVIVKALEPVTQTQVSDDAEAIVRVLQNVSIDIAPDPQVGGTLIKGQNAVFNVTVVNPSQADLTAVEVKATIDTDLAALGVAMPAEPVPATACDKVIGELGPGKEVTYSCTIPNVQASFQIEVQVSALIDGITETTDFDIDEISVINMTLEVFAVPFELLAGELTPVEFNMTLSNVSTVPLTLSGLVSNLHGNLLDGANGNVTANTCPGLNLTIPAGEVRTCAYEVSLMLQSSALTNVVTANISGGNNQQLTVVDEALVSVADFSPLVVVVNADPPSVVAPGGLSNLHVQVTNNTSSELTLDALNDSILGDLDGQGNCEIPRAIQGNGSYSCTYTVEISGDAGDVVTHVVTAIADAKEASSSAAVQVTGSEQTRMLLPAVSSLARAGEPNNSVNTALTLSTGVNYYFQADDATDWYKVTISSPARLMVKLGGFATAGQLVVYHTIDKPIGHNGDIGIVPNRQIDLGVQQPGTYYIWVITNEPSAASSSFLYSLQVEATAP
ncbi:MAG: cadherin domain-containing protein [Anaerolineae bacterium]|nr:cadherin domain-containing protein [Anaerolineae bacterium]